jgi:hypothetical protein
LRTLLRLCYVSKAILHSSAEAGDGSGDYGGDGAGLLEVVRPQVVDHLRIGLPDPGIGGFDPVELAIEQYGEFADEAMRSGALKPFNPEDLSRPALERRVEPRAFLRCAKTWNIPIPDGLAPVLMREPARPPVVPSNVLEQIGHGYLGADYIEEAREQVLGAALAAIKAHPERCVNAVAIRRIIDANASLLWPATRRPPLTSMEMERLIGRWLDRLV